MSIECMASPEKSLIGFPPADIKTIDQYRMQDIE